MSGLEELRNSVDWQSRLYQHYHQKVFGICLYFLKDREEAKDAAHDVFIKAFRAWKDFEWKCDPMTWIGAIAKHDCFSRRQKARKRVDYRARLAMEEEARLEGEPGEDLLLYRLRLEKAMPAVRGKLREILRLSQQGLNHREIAVRMGVSRVAITRRLTRFKRNFQGAGLCPENSEKASGRMPFRADRTLGRNAPKAPIVRTLALEPAAQEPVFRLIAA